MTAKRQPTLPPDTIALSGSARPKPSRKDRTGALAGLPPQSERDFANKNVVPLAHLFGWKVYRTWLSIHSPKGFPDLVLCRPPRLLFRELKTDKGKLTREQENWIHVLCGKDRKRVASNSVGPDRGGVAMRIPLFPIDTASPAWQRFQAAVDSVVFGGSSPWSGWSAMWPAVCYKVLGGQTAYASAAVTAANAWVNAENALIAKGQPAQIANDHYLYVRDYLPPICAALDWCGGFLPTFGAGWTAYIQQTLFNLLNPSLATWGSAPQGTYKWDGWGWNLPGRNYHSGFLLALVYATLALGTDPAPVDAQFFASAAYMATLPEGSSREGTNYGQRESYLIHAERTWALAGNHDYSKDNLHCAGNIAYWVHATSPDYQQFAPFGDQPRVSIPSMYDTNRELMLVCQERIS